MYVCMYMYIQEGILYGNFPFPILLHRHRNSGHEPLTLHLIISGLENKWGKLGLGEGAFWHGRTHLAAVVVTWYSPEGSM